MLRCAVLKIISRANVANVSSAVKNTHERSSSFATWNDIQTEFDV